MKQEDKEYEREFGRYKYWKPGIPGSVANWLSDWGELGVAVVPNGYFLDYFS